MRLGSPTRWWLLVLAVAMTSAGCEALRVPWPRDLTTSTNPLKPINGTSDTVRLDVRFVHAPYGDERLNTLLWQQADEQILGADTRKRLGSHGLRAGVIGGILPIELQRLLELDRAGTEVTDEQVLTEFEARPSVTQRQYSLRGGQRSEIQTGSVVEHMNLLLPAEGTLQGRTLHQAQAVMNTSVRAEPHRGHARLSLLPELHYGPPTTRYGHDAAGVLVLEPGREREAFPDLKIEVSLTPGQMLLVGCDPDLAGSLGDLMFSKRKASPRQQTWLLIRLASDLRREDL